MKFLQFSLPRSVVQPKKPTIKSHQHCFISQGELLESYKPVFPMCFSAHSVESIVTHGAEI